VYGSNYRELIVFTDYCRGQASAQHVGYEIPGELDAYEILPPNLLEGKNYWVDRRIVSFGFTNRYTIYSHFGKFEAHGDEMLRTRQQEIRAIESLREIKRTKAFGDAVKKAVKSPIKGAKALITNPVDTVKGVPKGVGRFFGRIGEMVKGGCGDQEESVVKELIGFSATSYYKVLDIATIDIQKSQIITSVYFSTNFNDAELMQYLSFVVGGPSSNTCPR